MLHLDERQLTRSCLEHALFHDLKGRHHSIEYCNATNRRLTFEYILLKGINDTTEHALELVKWLEGTHALVNLIPYNAVDESGYQRSEEKSITNFFNVLKKYKINVTIRREFGKDIEAACGQLRAKHVKEGD